LQLTHTVFAFISGSLPVLPNFEPRVPLTAAPRPARVPEGNSLMASSGQSNRSQFQIGNTCVSPASVGRAGLNLSRTELRDPRRKRSHSAPTACACSPAQGLCLLGTGWANPQQAGLPVPPKLASMHLPLAGPEPAERATNHSRLATAFSLAASSVEANRYTARLELPVTHSKQTPLVLSNRYKNAPPVRVPSWLPNPLHPSLLPGTHIQTVIAVTPTKQTTALLSTRYKKPPPGGVTKC
jgi:hypothetical protein